MRINNASVPFLLICIKLFHRTFLKISLVNNGAMKHFSITTDKLNYKFQFHTLSFIFLFGDIVYLFILLVYINTTLLLNNYIILS